MPAVLAYAQPESSLLSFADTPVTDSWAFRDKTRKDTAYITHGYHRYPAKFIPQVAARLVETHSAPDDVVADVFAGCGTTLVEAKMLGRKALGTDINPVAAMITQAKITPINPATVEIAHEQLASALDTPALNTAMPDHERIDYWFMPEQKRQLAHCLNAIQRVKHQNLRQFFLCAFSNILKNCSIWAQKSNKPIRDYKKNPAHPIDALHRQIKAMKRGNAEFYARLQQEKYLDIPCTIDCRDARAFPAQDSTVGLVVTSPPYVTSYEYGDLHQLAALWLEHTDDVAQFRRLFIGSAYHKLTDELYNPYSPQAQSIVCDLSTISKKTALSVAHYFSSMANVFQEMHRMLKPKGKACIVIGNTKLKGVPIRNAEVFAEQLDSQGFRLQDVIKREIPSKNLPSVRNEQTGRFTKITDKNQMMAYPTEYILIAEKKT
ncbi:MAG: site-specific DNA-methyltransferase [Alphaproteobacteria bacterium GM202ARS2]|nr:site-specific DNA-methyltransferase [Alphaproteobacteria bacterium GM202ARS2]